MVLGTYVDESVASIMSYAMVLRKEIYATSSIKLVTLETILQVLPMSVETSVAG